MHIQKDIAPPRQGLPFGLVAGLALITGYYLSLSDGELPVQSALLWNWAAAWLCPAIVLAYCLATTGTGRWTVLKFLSFCAALAALMALWLLPGISNLALALFAVALFAQQGAGEDISLINTSLRYLYGIGRAFVALICAGPMAVAGLVTRLRQGQGRLPIRELVLPIFALIAFSWLLSAANPLIEQALRSVSLLSLPNIIGTAFFWSTLLVFLFIAAISHAMRLDARHGEALLAKRLPGTRFIGKLSVLLTLAAMNLLFLVENATDAAVLWSGRLLPEHMTYAEFAHRGAYTLIATSFLAAALITFVMRPGSDNEQAPLLRALAFAWMAQNLFLVASTVLRVMNYVDAYGWTFMRLSALIWLGLVAAGFCLIGLRLAQRRTSKWLLEANAWALLLTLLVTGSLDFDQITQRWNDSRWLTHAENVQYQRE